MDIIKERSNDNNNIQKTPKRHSHYKVKQESNQDIILPYDLGFLGGPRKRKGRKLIAFQILSALVDGFLILALTLFCCLFVGLILKISVSELNSQIAISSSVLHSYSLINIKKSLMEFSFLQVFLFSFMTMQFIYLVILRAFIGYTLGEKTFDIRLGLFQERYLLSYPARVIYRSFLILFTGIIILPLLSWLLGKDIAGEISGLKITSLT